MTKIEKTDIENITILQKELKSKNLNSIKIKKKDYELEISIKQNHNQQNINHAKKEDKTEYPLYLFINDSLSPIKFKNYICIYLK